MQTIAYPTLVARGDEPIRFTLPSDAGIRLVRCGKPEVFIDVLGEHLFGLVIASSGNVEVETLVRRLILSAPDAHFVLTLLGQGASRALELLAGQRLAVLSDAVDRPVLVQALRRAWFEGQVERIRRSARRPALPAVVRCAVLRILDERIRVKAPEPDEVTLCRTLEDLAERCGADRDTLRRARGRCDLDLSALMREWTAILALHERFVERDLPSAGVWATIARRCGYESESGLRGLMKRELRTGLPDLDLGHLQELLVRLQSHVAGTELA